MSFHPEKWTTKRLENLFERHDQLYWDATMPLCQIELDHSDLYGMRTFTRAELEENRTPTCIENHDNDAESRDSLLRTMAGFGKKERGLFSELDRKWRLQIRWTNAGNRWLASR